MSRVFRKCNKLLYLIKTPSESLFMRNILILFIVIFLTSCVSISEKPISRVSCEILKSGIVGQGTWIGEIIDIRTTSQITQEFVGINILKETTRIPLEKNINFGVEYIFSGLNIDEMITQQIIHPMMIKPDGTSSTGYTKNKEPGEGTSYILNRNYELVEGRWKFIYFHSGIKLCEQTFDVYKT